MRTALAVTLLCLCAPTTSLFAQQLPAEVAGLRRATEIDVGSLCLTEIPAGAIVPLDSRLQADGLWWRVRIDVKRSAPRKPNAFFFRTPRKAIENNRYVPCSEGQAQAEAFVKGRLIYAAIEAFYRPASETQSARWQVNPGQLDVEFGRADARITPLFGSTVIAHDARAGTSVLSGRTLWVKNPSTRLFYNLTAGVHEGILAVSTTDVMLSKTTLMLGSGRASIDLMCRAGIGPDEGRVTFTIDVSNGHTGMSSGECTTADVDLPVGQWKGAGVTATIKSARSRKVTLKGSATQPLLEIASIDVVAEAIDYAPSNARVVPTANVTIAALEGAVESRADALRIETATWRGVTIADAHFEVLSPLAVSGRGEATIAMASPDHVNIVLTLRTAVIQALAPLAQVNISGLGLRVVGPPASPVVSGTLGASSMQLGALGLREEVRPLSFVCDRPGVGGAVFSFDWDVSTPSGTFQIGDPDGQNVALSGRLKSLRLKGALRVAPGQADPEITLAPGGLVFEATAKASVSPLVLGSPVEFLEAALSLRSPSGVVITRRGAQGSVDVGAKTLIFATPSLVFANPDQGFVIQAPLKTDGAASLRVDIGSGRTRIQHARIVAEKLSARSLDQAKEVKVSGMTLVSPELTIAQLSLTIDEGIGSVRGEGLHFLTTALTHEGPPFWKVALSPQTGITVPQFDARLGDIGDALSVEDVTARELAIEGLEAEFRSADGFSVSGNNIKVSAETMSDRAIGKGHLSIQNGVVRIATATGASLTQAKGSFHEFNVSLDGPKDRLTGAGALRLRDISVGGRTRLAVGKCLPADGWKVTGAVDIGAVNLDVRLEEGKLIGSAHVSDGKAHVVNDGHSICEWDEDFVSEGKVAVYNSCPLTGNCETKTKITPDIRGRIHWIAEVHQLQASAAIQSATVSAGGDGSLRVCLNQLTLNPPVIVANYHPNIREGGFLQNMLRDLIRGVATLFESSIATSVGTSASLQTHLAAGLGLGCS